ncbi:MAG: GumC family protein [Candidatus Scalinduaceae bacterium]
MEEKKTFDLQIFIKPLLRRKWFWIIPTIIFSIGATYNAINLRDVYESRCVLYVERSKLLADVLAQSGNHISGTRSDARKILRTIQERMLGWENVVEVIRTLGLNKGLAENDTSALEGKYNSIVNNTTLSLDNRRRNVVSVSYIGPNPEMNSRIVEGLVSNFMVHYKKLAQTEADETLTFIDEDIKRLKRTLDESEAKLRKFEGEHLNELPGSENSKLSRMSTAESEITDINREIAVLNERISFFQERKEKEGEVEGVEIITPKISSLNNEIIHLEIEIEMLSVKYYDDHPDIVLRQKELEQLKEALEREVEKGVTEGGMIAYNPRYENLVEREFDLQLQLRSLQSRREEAENLVASLKESIKDIPGYNQEFYELQKDYDVNKQIYEQRVLQRSKAVLAKNISLDKRGDPFKILEHARKSDKPIKVYKMRVLGMGLITGLGLGIGLVLGLERIDQRFKTIGEVQQYLQIPALGMIPTILTKMDRKRKVKKRLVLASILTVLVITAIVVSFVVQPVKVVVNDNVTKVIKLVK